jgi:hypothetical protein
MAILLGYRGEQHVPRALESGQLSGHCGLRIWLNGERPVAIDPFKTLSRLAFLGSFVNIVRMTVVVITLANLWWRST